MEYHLSRDSTSTIIFLWNVGTDIKRDIFNFKRGPATAIGDLYCQQAQMIKCLLVVPVTAAVPFVGLPGAHAVGAAGLRLPGQPQTGAVLLVSNLNEQVRNRVAIATES